MTNSPTLNDRTYRAPQEHGQVLSVPPLQEAGPLATENRCKLDSAKVEFAGQPFAKYRASARQEILAVAARFTSQFANVRKFDSVASPIFVTGHQPQFVHPGVWAKNLAVSLFAKQQGGIGLNLIVDNDVADLFGVVVPDGSTDSPHLSTVLFDDPQIPQPWEEIRLKNRTEFESFPNRVQQRMTNWNIDSSLQDVWTSAMKASNQCDCTILPLTAVRANLEREFGLGNLEIPVSLLCETTAFLQFAASIILQHVQFFSTYNEAVAWYREVHNIRNHRHPVPDLELANERYELPFWYWKQGEQQRERVFVKREGAEVILYAGETELFRSSEADLLPRLRLLQKHGKLRTKALTTTMFTRIAVADLFVHGIGGAKYDEITDRIIANFFKLPVPVFLTLSATLHLPLKSFPVIQDDLLDQQKQLRDLKFNADRYLDSEESKKLFKRKQELIAEHQAKQTVGLCKSERLKNRPQNRKRHLELKSIQQQLKALASDKIEQCELELQKIASQLRANAILNSREFAAVLFPKRTLSNLVNRLTKLITND